MVFKNGDSLQPKEVLEHRVINKNIKVMVEGSPPDLRLHEFVEQFVVLCLRTKKSSQIFEGSYDIRYLDLDNSLTTCFKFRYANIWSHQRFSLTDINH